MNKEETGKAVAFFEAIKKAEMEWDLMKRKKSIWSLFALSLLAAVYEFFEHGIPVRREYEVETEDEISNLKLLLLSDLHGNPLICRNKAFFKRIQKENPDAVLIPGDLVNRHRDKDFSNVSFFCRKLSEIAPVVFSLGNHEQNLKKTMPDAFLKFLAKLPKENFFLLDNQEKELILQKKKVVFYGCSVEKEYYQHRPPFSLPEQELPLPSFHRKKSTILLLHTPDYFENRTNQAALTVSGHIHGGIIRLPFLKGILSPQQLFPKFTRGCYQKEGSTLVVSAGIGSHTLPARLFNRIEYCVIKTKTRKSV